MTTEPKKPSPSQRLKLMKVSRAYWQERARIDTASLSRTLKRVAEVEEVCAEIEREIEEGKRDSHNSN